MTKRAIKNVLVVGSEGQIGSELVVALRERYGADRVVASDIKSSSVKQEDTPGPFEFADVTDAPRLREICAKYHVDTLINMAAILSAKGEKDPVLAWRVNVTGLMTTLELARELELRQILCPSSIAVFGAGCPRENTPQETVLKPSSMYGITKVAGELLCDYYVKRFGVDARGLRYPGIISSETLPGGGTTDYAVEMYYRAVEGKEYTCFVREDTRLPMMYMHDCIKATMDLMEADFDKLRHHGDFNIAAMSFSAGELAASIREHVQQFSVIYKPDYRQEIADSWPSSIDDSAAREEWGWSPTYGLAEMTKDMLARLGERQEQGNLYR